MPVFLSQRSALLTGALQILTLALLLMAPALVDSHPICVDSSFPYKRNPATFTKCPAWNNLKTCISPAEEASAVTLPTFPVNEQPTATCRRLLTDIGCAVADQWSGHIYKAEGPGEMLAVPTLCPEFCGSVYAACGQQRMSLSPLVDNSSTMTTIKTKYPTQQAFCDTFGGTDYCFKGVPFTIEKPAPFVPAFSLCLERVWQGGEPKVTFLPVPGHPDYMIISDLEGLVRLYRVNNSASGTPFLAEATVLDLRSKVLYQGEMGLLGVELHKNFATNGRFYVSFTCVGSEADINCNSQDSVIDEYRVNDPSSVDGIRANLTSRRRIFRISQPYSNHNGGQVLFSPDPEDPHLYFMLGDGGSGGDPRNRAQPLNTYYGKILRIDVDTNAPIGGPGIAPADNPFINVEGALGMIWANGLRNPWRCSFDRDTFILYCGDVGQGIMEEISVITRGANYGWRRFEGTRVYNGDTALQGSPIHTPPIIAYTHSEVGAGGYASVIGGYVVRTDRDPRMENKYIFADLAGPLYIAQESPPNSGQWTKSRIETLCSSSALPCTARGSILSFGEMLNGDIVFGNDAGSIFRFVEPEKCPTKAPTPLRPCNVLSLRLCRRRRDCRVSGGRRCRRRSG